MKSFEERLRSESEGWVEDGIIDDHQRVRLLARHSTGEGNSRFVAILATVGGALLLAGVCLLISANWQDLGDWLKIGALIVLLVGSYAAGWRLKVAPGQYPKVGDAFFMLGAGLFLAGIALVSQIFHLNSRPATGVLTWWLGIVAIPWLVRSKGAQAISLLAFLVWLGMEFTTTASWLSLRPYGYATGDSEIQVIALMSGLGLAVWLVGLALRATSHERFASLHEKWGALIVCACLYGLSFLRYSWLWRSSETAVNYVPVLLVAGLIGIAAVGAFRGGKRELLSLAPWLFVSLIPVGAVLAGWNLGDHGWLWSALSWASLFVLNVFMICVGLATGREGWVNLGIAFIALNVVTRYFDLFGTMLEGGLFFVISGVIVLTLGIYLERKRRGWLASMRAEKEVS